MMHCCCGLIAVSPTLLIDLSRLEYFCLLSFLHQNSSCGKNCISLFPALLLTLVKCPPLSWVVLLPYYCESLDATTSLIWPCPPICTYTLTKGSPFKPSQRILRHGLIYCQYIKLVCFWNHGLRVSILFHIWFHEKYKDKFQCIINIRIKFSISRILHAVKFFWRKNLLFYVPLRRTSFLH